MYTDQGRKLKTVKIQNSETKQETETKPKPRNNDETDYLPVDVSVSIPGSDPGVIVPGSSEIVVNCYRSHVQSCTYCVPCT